LQQLAVGCHPKDVLALDKRTVRIVITLLVCFAILALFWAARQALAAGMVAWLFAYVLDPLVQLSERIVRRRNAAIAIVYAVLVPLVGLGIWLGAPSVSREAEWLRTFWSMLDKGSVPVVIHARGGVRGDVIRWGCEWWRTHHVQVKQWLAGHAQLGFEVLGASLWAIVVPILAIWILRDKRRWISWLADSARTPSGRQKMCETLLEIDRTFGRFIWSQLILSVFAFLAYPVGLWLLRVPQFLLLAAIAGVLEPLFVVGPLTTAIVVMAASIFSEGSNPLFVFLFLVLWRIFQDYVNTPLLFGKRMALHPLLIVFVLVVGWEADGVLGMLLAVPFAASLRAAWECSGGSHIGRELLGFLGPAASEFNVKNEG
jgi:predicted PurR-regulated permease PerM